MYAITYKANGLPVTLSGLSADGIDSTLSYLESEAITSLYSVTDLRVTGGNLPGIFGGTRYAWQSISHRYGL